MSDPGTPANRDKLDTYDSISGDLNVAHAVVYASAMALNGSGTDPAVIASALEFAAEWIDVARVNFRAAFDPSKPEEAAAE